METKNIVYKHEKPDPQQYMKLFETTGWNKKYGANLRELTRALENSWCVVAAYDDELLTGIGRVVSDGVLYAMIYDMIVLPDYQNQGIGARILKMLVERCESAGMRDIQLFSAKGKAAFYHKRGFKARPDDGPGMSLVS